MTTSIPAPLPNSSSSADNSTPATGIDTLISSLGNPAQGGAANQGSASDFGTMLDASSSQPPSNTPAAGQTPASAAEGASETTTNEGKADSSAEKTDPQEPSTSPMGSKRDVAEAVASMLSPLWIQSLPPQPLVAPVAGGAGGKAPAGGPVATGSGTPAAPVPDSAVQAPLGNNAIVASLPGLYGKLSAAMNASLGVASPTSPTGAPAAGGKGQKPTSQGILPAVGASLSAPAAPAAASAPYTASRHTENFAGDGGPNDTAPVSPQASLKKNFVVPEEQDVNSGRRGDGIGIAKASANMPAPSTTSHPTGVSPEVTPSASPSVAAFSGAFASPSQVPAAPAAITPTLAPVLALRAVETVLNVVDAQQVGSGQGGAVKLDFNFGGEALAVHVQMRGGEVHTEFRTNSTELRSALSSQWNVAAGQRDADGVRLVEPVFSSAQGGSSTANGNSANTNLSFQQQGSQQQASSGPQQGALRSVRSAAPLPDSEDPVLAQPAFHPTSQHLAAVA